MTTGTNREPPQDQQSRRQAEPATV
jgi:hypothetical protein